MSLVDGDVFVKLRLPRMQRTWAHSRAKDNFRHDWQFKIFLQQAFLPEKRGNAVFPQPP